MAFATELKAQYDPSFSHYWTMESAYNPAAVGKENKLNVVVAYNMSMTGFENNHAFPAFGGHARRGSEVRERPDRSFFP